MKKKLLCQRVSLLRNIITHNNSKVNEIYLSGIANFKIDDAYKSEESILPHLEKEINNQRSLFNDLAKQIISDLENTDNLKKLEEQHKNRNL